VTSHSPKDFVDTASTWSVVRGTSCDEDDVDDVAVSGEGRGQP